MPHKAYRFRILPTPAQAKALGSQLETLRRVYNTVLGYWNAKSDAWVVAHPATGEKKPRPKLTPEERAELKRKREADKLARKSAPPKKKNHNKTDEQRETERAKWKENRYPCLNEVYEFLTTLRSEPLPEGDKSRPDPKYLANSLILMSMLRDTAERVRKAFKRFWDVQKGLVTIPKPKKPRKDGRPHGYPRFKRYGELSSINFAQYGSGCNLRGGDGRALKANVPAARRGYRLDVSCVGRIRVIAHRAIEGVIKNATVSRDVDGKWYVALMAETPDAGPVEPKGGPAVGVDVGLEHFLTTSDGEHVASPKPLQQALKALRRVNRSKSRKFEAWKGEGRKVKLYTRKNYQKARLAAARLHVKVRNQRKEHHNKVARSLVSRYGKVAFEKLGVRGMLKNGRLARAISDAGWSGFLGTLKRLCEKAGVSAVEVDARGTSQICSRCGKSVPKKLSQRWHACPHCSLSLQRDHNAAVNIRNRAFPSNPAGPVGAVRVDDSPSLGMPPDRSRSGGGGRGRRKTPAETPKPKVPKPNRSRKGSQQPSLPGMD